MKTKQIKPIATLLILAIAFFGCADQVEETPVDIQDSLSRVFTNITDIQVGENTYKKETTVRVVIDENGNLVSSEVLSITLDGAEMQQMESNRWAINMATGVITGNQGVNQSAAGLTDAIDEICESVSTVIGFVPVPLNPMAGLCVINTETTCYNSYIGDDGVLTTEISVDNSISLGACTPF
jgi:hypothetical protein